MLTLDATSTLTQQDKRGCPMPHAWQIPQGTYNLPGHLFDSTVELTLDT
jgi:hypothetical protein